MSSSVEAGLQQAAALIEAAPSVALACHVAPDGDALGSMLGLHHLCRSQAKPSVASWSEPFVVAPHYEYLPGLDTCTKPADFPPAPTLMLTFDCGSLARLGDLATPATQAEQLVVVDHHATNDRFGTLNVVDEDAAATAVLVKRLADILGWPLNKDAATCLYTGIVTDTGRFQYSSTTPAVFRLAEELAGFDLPIAQMTRQLFEEHRFAYLQLAGLALSRAVLRPELSLVEAWVTCEDMERFSVCVDEVEGLIDLVRRTAEAEVACVCKETPDGVRVSLRSITHTGADGTDTGVHVGELAGRFGGGGHRYAGGFTMCAPVPEVLAAVEDGLRDQLCEGR